MSVIFIRLPDMSGCRCGPLIKLFGGGDVRHSDVYHVRRVKTCVVGTRRIFRSVGRGRTYASSTNGVCVTLKLSALGYFVQRAGTIRFCFLSSSRRRGVSGLVSVVGFCNATSFSEVPMRGVCYRTHHGSLGDVVNEASRGVRFTSSSGLSILRLLGGITCRPTTFIRVSARETIIASSFGTLIINFKRAKHSTFGFLCRFDSFLKPSNRLTPHAVRITSTGLDRQGAGFLGGGPTLGSGNSVG